MTWIKTKVTGVHTYATGMDLHNQTKDGKDTVMVRKELYDEMLVKRIMLQLTHKKTHTLFESMPIIQ